VCGCVCGGRGLDRRFEHRVDVRGAFRGFTIIRLSFAVARHRHRMLRLFFKKTFFIGKYH
jgi:hypothetical protein